jgi:hypothetical protein
MELEKARTFFNATLLPQFGLFSSFLNALAETDGVFGGSIVLQAVLQEVYPNSDIDIFFSSTDYKAFMHGVLIAHNYSRIHTSNVQYSALNAHIIVSYKHNSIGKQVQLIFYDGGLALNADIAAASFIYNSRDEQFDLHGHPIELLRKHITYMFPNVNYSAERFNKYKERGFIILKDKPVVLDCCKSMAPLLHNEYEHVQEADMATFSHSGRYFNLD